MVAQDVRTVTWEVAIFWVAVLSLVVTLVYGERQRPNHAIQQRSDGERLRLAWEEGALRPDLVVSFEWAVMEYPPPNRGSQYVIAAIVFRITNNGKSAAHNVHCEIRLDEERSEPDDMHRKNRDFYAPDMEPKASSDRCPSGWMLLENSVRGARFTCRAKPPAQALRCANGTSYFSERGEIGCR